MVGKQARILVVEDEPHVAADIALRLTNLGYEVLGPVDSGREAVRIADSARPDLVFMDIVLPGDMDGVEAAAQIQRLSIPVVYLTAHAHDELLERAKITEPLGYLIKPYTERELEATTVMALYRHAVERQLAACQETVSHARQEVDAKQRMLSTLLGNLPGMVYRCGGQDLAAMEFVSEGCRSLTGYSAHQLMSGEVDFHKLIHPGDQQQVWDAIDRTALGERFQVEYRLQHADGSERWVWEQGCGVLDAQGKLEFYEGFISDVSVQKRTAMLLQQASEELQQKVDERTRHLQEANDKLEREIAMRVRKEAELAESQGQLQAILDNAPTLIYVKDLQGRYQLVNRVWQQRMHLSAEQVAGKTSAELLPAGLAQTLMQHDTAVIEAGRAMDFEEAVPINGDERTYFCTKFPLYGPDGAVSGVCGIATDITERKRADRALAASEAKYRALMENAPDAILIADANGCIVDGNHRAQELLGCDKPALMKLAISDLHPAQELPSAQAHFAKLVQGTPVVFEGHFLSRTGVSIPVEIHGSLIESGGQRLAQGIIRDIRERRRHEEERLRQERAQRDTLIREVHHRIKNNLQGVIGLIQRHVSAHPELQDAMASIATQVQSIAVVHGLQGQGEDTQMRLCDMVQEISRNAGVLTQGEHVPLLRVAVSAPFLVDKEEAVAVALIINELLHNAIKHCPTDPDRAQVRLEVSQAQRGAEVSVVNPGKLPSGFDFAANQGSGTGLALVRSLLPRQGARLDIRQVGAEVRVTLSLEKPVVQQR